MCDLCHYTPCIRGCPNYDEDQDGYEICPSCGSHLYQGDIKYPEFEICEYCIDDYRVEVDLMHFTEPEEINEV